MAGFADAFSAENIGHLMNDPRMLLGLQMLQQGGYQPGNPGFGQRFGQAGLGAMQQMQEQNRQRQLAEYRNSMIQAQAADMQMRQQAAQAKQEQLQRQQQAFQDPAVQDQLGPIAKMLAAAGLGPDVVLKANSADNLNAHRQATLAQQASQFDQRLSHQGGGQSSGPRMPTQRQVLDEPLGEGMVQRHVLNPQTGQYEKYGEPFNQYSPGRKSAGKPARGADAALENILGGEPPAAGVDASSLPGTGGLADFAPQPQPQQPVGIFPMAAKPQQPMVAAGSNPNANKAKAPPKPAVDDNLKAAGAAIAAGKSRQAVVSRLMQAGYTAEQIQAAGI
ncbi:hypothetical protein [Pseudomonas putida]|uniref:hypothetical protein n=1 Tax=Pseudomonas putida TaxID=303 RepID=UPI0002F213F7|nr:hypothetical protein [Pseudomonas putida]